MNMFVSAPRSLLPSQDSSIEGLYPIEVIERHPYTTQTFIPLGLSSSEVNDACYLVIVAPTLPPTTADETLPVPYSRANHERLPGRGFPDLQKIRAFIANGSQGVTYGAGTWHAPMVVIGKKAISFVVVQYANGVGIEDCQEVNVDCRSYEWIARIDDGGHGVFSTELSWQIAIRRLWDWCGQSGKAVGEENETARGLVA
ncbi:Ureidoglycolatase [Hyphodiscus hymeniophilus]|uniref:Ureidoglycolatase n=1 Tax=Hyphodiscus hymeniophilus TaxID=353542 RepID=A0A9P6VFJ6_9HELO|nr:Ureidoglycolatase [Hyphodiscus hymeniophilus]